MNNFICLVLSANFKVKFECSYKLLIIHFYKLCVLNKLFASIKQISSVDIYWLLILEYKIQLIFIWMYLLSWNLAKCFEVFHRRTIYEMMSHTWPPWFTTESNVSGTLNWCYFLRRSHKRYIFNLFIWFFAHNGSIWCQK